MMGPPGFEPGTSRAILWLHSISNNLVISFAVSFGDSSILTRLNYEPEKNALDQTRTGDLYQIKKINS